MATLENIKLSMSSNYFSQAASQLPLGMFSNATANIFPNDFKYSQEDYDHSLPRINEDLETPQAWDFASNNFSDNHIDKTHNYTIKSIRETMKNRNNSLYSKSQLATSQDYPTSWEYENPFKIPLSILDEVNRYNFVYKNASLETIDVGQDGDQVKAAVVNSPISSSLFNDCVAVNSIGMMENVPLLNVNTNLTVDVNQYNYNESKDPTESNHHFELQKYEDMIDISNCTIRKLVELSQYDDNLKTTKLGRATYKWADFMYCKDLGKVSNNMLITLRKFPCPVGDNIFSSLGYGEDSEGKGELDLPPDIGRMVAWLGNDNKLEDIIKFSTKDSWKPLTAEDQQMENQDDTTPLGSLFSLGNPKYITAISKGTAGGKNGIIQKFTSGANSAIIGGSSNNGLFNAQGQYEGNPAMNGYHYDKNKVYTKQGTVQDTHIYEGKLEFTHSFRLVFDYELRAYENINPKSAFLDLLGNILITTYRKGTFWGGSRSTYGSPGIGKTNGWKVANQLIDKAAQGTGDIISFIFSGGKDSQAFKAKMTSWGKDWKNMAEQGITAVKDFFKNGGAVKIGDTISQIFGGSMKNALGRPQVYAFNSLLTGEPVGLWHVTIGNPRNPILSMGNLIIENTEYQMYGPLGIDDFPTGIKVSVSLKHAKSRDAAEIANMFTRGESTINFKLIGGNSKGSPEMYLNKDMQKRRFGTTDIKKVINAMATAGG